MIMATVLRIVASLKRLCDTVIFIGWKKQVLREINLHAVPLSDSDCWWNLDEVVENRRGRLRDAGRRTVGKGLRTGAIKI